MVTRTYDRGFGEIVTFDVPELAAGLCERDAWIVHQTLKGIRVYLGTWSEELETVLYQLGYKLRLRPDGTHVPEPRPSNDHALPGSPGRRITFTYRQEQEAFLKSLKQIMRSYGMSTDRIINIGNTSTYDYTTVVDVEDVLFQDALLRAQVTAMVDGHVWGLDTTS